MQIKTTMYLLTPVETAIIKITMAERVWSKENPPVLLRYKLLQALWKTVWRFLRKLKIELPYNLVIPLLDIYLDEIINHRYPYIHSNTVHNSQDTEST